MAILNMCLISNESILVRTHRSRQEAHIISGIGLIDGQVVKMIAITILVTGSVKNYSAIAFFKSERPNVIVPVSDDCGLLW